MLVGEIGIQRRTALYDLAQWEVLAIIRGYRRRQEEEWRRTRWQTFVLMHCGMADLSKSHINTPEDILPLPHDHTDTSSQPTADEVEDMRAELRRLNQE